MFASMVVTLALVFYSTGFFKERKKRLVTASVLSFYTMGVLLDISATILMILGSSKGMLTIHGFIGYSSLLGMLVDTILLWRFNWKYGTRETVNPKLRKYSLIAYTWWAIAYLTGAILVAARHIG